MPAEYVRGSQDFGSDQHDEETLVKVTWGGEYVQLASVARDKNTHDPVALPEGDGWYVTLDRRGINDLIKKLRHARDRAYGRDE